MEIIGSDVVLSEDLTDSCLELLGLSDFFLDVLDSVDVVVDGVIGVVTAVGVTVGVVVMVGWSFLIRLPLNEMRGALAGVLVGVGATACLGLEVVSTSSSSSSGF